MRICDFVKTSERLAHFKYLLKNSTRWCLNKFNQYENQNKRISLKSINQKKDTQPDPRDIYKEVPMLVFSCSLGQSVLVSKNVQIMILGGSNQTVHLGITGSLFRYPQNSSSR